MTKEEREKLKKEYDEFSKKNYYGSTLMYPFYFAFGFSLIIFWLPKDILTQYPSFRYFTQFMADIFPNINVFASRSKISELTEFYFSYMWLIAILMTIYAISLIPKANEEAKRFFGTGKYKGRGKLLHKYIEVVSIFNRKGFWIFLWILMMGFGLYATYTGNLIDGGISKLRFGEIINTKFGMFFLGNLFQNGVILLNITLFTMITLNEINIKKIKKGE